MRVTLNFDGISTDQLRLIATKCSQNREAFPYSTEPWQPRVQCDGADFFGVQVSPVTLDVAQQILHALEEHEMRTSP